MDQTRKIWQAVVFYHAGNHVIQCFSCNLKLHVWSTDESLLKMHIFFKSDCTFLGAKYSPGFILDIKEEVGKSFNSTPVNDVVLDVETGMNTKDGRSWPSIPVKTLYPNYTSFSNRYKSFENLARDRTYVSMLGFFFLWRRQQQDKVFFLWSWT